MRRITILLTALVLVSAASLALASAAPAGDFADDPCPNSSGDNYLCPSATVGVSYALDIKLKEPWPGCSSMRISSGAFPPGLSLSSDGNIRGTPTAGGSYTFYITVSWSDTAPCVRGANTDSDRKFTINVNTPVPRLFVATNSLPDARIAQAYSAPALTAANGSVSSWAIVSGSLPPGLTLGANGAITGTPSASGGYSFTVQANGSPNSDTKQLSIFVIAPLELQTLTGKKPPTTGLTAKAALNVPLTTGLKAVGGRGPYVFSSVGALPPGIGLDAATGAITGAGTTAGKFSPTVTVTDATGAKTSVPFSFTILPLLDFVQGKTLPLGKVDGFYSARIPIRGRDARGALFALSGRIPPGLELDDTGRLTGRLLVAGVYRVRIFAFPTNGAPVTKFFTIRVRA